MFEAVILMGGFGRRLRTVSEGVPKSMMPIGDRPFLYLLLEKLERQGCGKIHLSLHYRAKDIVEKIKVDMPVRCDLNFIIEEYPLGTGGALKYAAEVVSGSSFLALNGDTYSSLNYADFFEKMKHEAFAIAAVKVKSAARYGALVVDDNKILQKINEKTVQGSSLINSGTYIISKSALKEIKQEVFSFEQVFIPRLLGKARVFNFDGEFIDIGIPEDYVIACELLR